MKAIGSDEETYVPKDNSDLVRVYQTYVTRLVMKYNRVPSNFEDLVQHTWGQLFIVDVLKKYHRSVGNQQPAQMTAEQAAAYLQMAWGQWKVMNYRFRVGDKRDPIDQIDPKVKKAVFDRDQGICSDPSHSGRPFDAIKFASALELQKKTNKKKHAILRAQMQEARGIPAGVTIFWVAEKISGSRSKDASGYKTTCKFCLQRDRAANGFTANGNKRTGWAPTPIKGGWSSKAALFETSDIEKLRVLRQNDKRTVRHGEIQIAVVAGSSPSHFKRYLARAVHNIYANWCRTRHRKYKEMYFAPSEDGQAWEASLPDMTMNQETKLILTEEANQNVDRVVDKLAKKVKKGEIKADEIARLIAEGYTLTEIIKAKNLPRTLLQVVRRRGDSG